LITLYEDQEKIVSDVRASMRKYKRILIRAETGSGKSVVASYMIQSAISKGHSCAFVVPRKELLRQMSETFREFAINHSFVAAGKPFNPYSKAHICTVGTLVNRLDIINPTIIFIDESHYGSGQLDKIIQYYTAKGVWVVGLTATPDNKHLHRWYQHMVHGPTIKELIAKKRLSDFRYFAPSTPDLSGIKTVAGEYSHGQLDQFMREQRVLIGDAVKHYREHAMGRLNMTFCTSIQHSEMVSAAFRDAGIPSVHMDGNTPEDQRRRIARAFATREVLNITSVDLLLFGYDLASASGIKTACVESMSDLRPTKSRNTQRQKIGRVLRYKDFPAMIFDHAGNYLVHDMPDGDIEWSLEAPIEKDKGGKSSVPTRQCKRCFFVHRPAPKCPECGYIYEVHGREIDHVDGDLVELNRDDVISQQKKQMRKSAKDIANDILYSDNPNLAKNDLDSLNYLIAKFKKEGHKNPAAKAAHVLAQRLAKKQMKGVGDAVDSG